MFFSFRRSVYTYVATTGWCWPSHSPSLKRDVGVRPHWKKSGAASPAVSCFCVVRGGAFTGWLLQRLLRKHQLFGAARESVVQNPYGDVVPGRVLVSLPGRLILAAGLPWLPGTSAPPPPAATLIAIHSPSPGACSPHRARAGKGLGARTVCAGAQLSTRGHSSAVLWLCDPGRVTQPLWVSVFLPRGWALTTTPE